jgi:hypothetical protein
MPSLSNFKKLRFIITLGTGKFGSSNNNRITLDGYRCTANIDKAGGMMMGTLKAKINGVSQQDMNNITTLQWKPQQRILNTVEVIAIEGLTETFVFSGNIVNAWGDYQGMPDVFLNIQAQSAFFNGIQSAKPTSLKGGVNVAVIMKKLADQMELTFENNGVSTVIVDPYSSGSLKDQALYYANACNFDLYIDDKTMAITTRNMPRKGAIPIISAESGMVGYPTFDGIGVNFQTLFNPAITFGGSIDIKTDIKQAAGKWVVTSMSHNLESEKPGGAWFSTIRGTANGLAIVR